MIKKLSILLILFALIAPAAICQSSFSSERLEAAIISYLKSQTNNDIEVEILQNVRTAVFEDDNVSAEFSHNIRNFKGIAKVSVNFIKNSKSIRKEDLKVRIKIFKTVPVAMQTLNIGHIVDESDIKWQRIDISNFNDEKMFHTTEVIGKKIGNSVIKGQPFMSDDIQAERIIKRGQNIEIIALSGAVSIRTLGTALQDGAVGDIIRVKRDGSGNSIMSGEVDISGAVILKSYRTINK